MNVLTAWLEDHFFQDVDPVSFYRFIFQPGELDIKGAYTPGKYTGIFIAVSVEKGADGRRKVRRYTITDDLEAVNVAVQSNDFCLCAPLSYAGLKRTAANARMLYAIAVDVDHIVMSKNGNPDGLESMWKQIEKAGYLPRPTFIVSSGTGLHLYYVLETPIPLYPNFARQLQEYKRELTRRVWNEAIVSIKSETEIQQEGIYQGFRMPGTITKNGARAVAFRTGDRVTMEYLNKFVDGLHKARRTEKKKLPGTVKLEEAAIMWPEWYERRIVNGEPRGAWHVNRALYDWWKGKIYSGAKVGHRYYCIMMLAIYAKKCGMYDAKHNPNPVTYEELEKDAYSFIDHLDAMTQTADNHFGADDVQAALQAYDNCRVTYPREAVEGRTGIIIPANKRNGNKQAAHLEEARAIRDIRSKRRGEQWDAHNGRKDAAEKVRTWRAGNPNGRKVDCIRDTGLDKKTVYKWWDGGIAARAKAAEMSVEKQQQRTLTQIEADIKKRIAEMRAAVASMEAAINSYEQYAQTMQEGAEKEKIKTQIAEQREQLQKMREQFGI